MKTPIWVLLLLLGIPVQVNAGDAQAGQAKAAVCAACHGATGQSVNAVWPHLAGQHAGYIEQQLQAFKSGARVNEQMAPIVPSLSEEDMSDIAAYFASQTRPEGTADPKLVPDGERIYRGGNSDTGVPACMACHGPAGSGNAGADYPALSGQFADYIAAQLRAYAGSQRGGAKAEIMQPIARVMTEREIVAVASYVAGLRKRALP
jgi:cytochrome c553